MGYNTSVIILNDCLNNIQKDKDFGFNLVNAICSLRPTQGEVNVRAGSCATAAKVIETHHSSNTVFVAVGGNRGELVNPVTEHNLKEEKELLEMLAYKHGYKLTPY